MKEKRFFLLFFLCLTNPNIYAQFKNPEGSGFIVHEISAEAENDIELIEYHRNMVSDRYSQYDSNNVTIYQGYFQEYVFYNSGDVPHKVGLGVRYLYESDIPTELFSINGVKVQHQQDSAKKYFGVDAMGYFVFIDVVFPIHENVKIKVEDLSYIQKRNNNFIFKGSPRFTATIGNRLIDRHRPYFEIERLWINDIFFNRHTESFVSMLEQEGSLSNVLFTIQKTNGNIWEIEFTKEFVDAHHSTLAFDIEFGEWGYIGGGYSPLWDNNRGLVFNSEERITPYQYIFLTNRQLQVVRNAYYARHGYIFRDTALKRMYEGFSDRNFGNINYRENPNFSESLLTDTDRANIVIIQRLESMARN
jgi:ACT domain-containing protein